MLFSDNNTQRKRNNPNKRGNIQDLMFIVVLGMITVTMIIIGMKVYDEIRTTKLFTETEASKSIRNHEDRLQNMWDMLFMMFFSLGALAAIVSAFLSGAHPIFLWASILMSMLLIIIGVTANNYFDTIISNKNFDTIRGDLQMTIFLFDNFGKFLTGFIVLLLIALYFPTRLKQ